MKSPGPRAGRTRVDAAAFTLARAGGTPDENEDSVRFSVDSGETETWTDFVAVVADGVGTSREPAAASRAATETWMQFLERRFTERPEDLPEFDEVQFGQLMRECFAQAHRQVQRNAPGGSATAAGTCIQGPWLLAATIGDARIYHFTGGRLRQITDDQIDGSGNPTDVLGGRAAAPNAAGYARPSLQPGDWVVACSDGLAKTVSSEALSAVLSASPSAAAAVEVLKQRAVAGQVQDDVTAVVARIDGVGAPFWADSDASAAEPEPRSRPRIPTAADPPPTSPKETAMRPSVDPALAEFESRLSRLERSPNGGGLSQQEQARLKQEFGRLEQEMAGMEARLLRASRLPLLAAIVALSAGLAGGYLLRGGMPVAVPASRDGSTTSSGPLKFDLVPPDDLLLPLEDQPASSDVILRYRSKDQKRKVAVYRYQDGGRPFVVYAVPESPGSGRRALRTGKSSAKPPP